MNNFFKFFRPLSSIIAIILFFYFTLSLCFAEIQSFKASGEYVMSKYETLDIAQQRALLEAQRNAVENAGVYIQSFTKVEDSQVTYDKIIAVASNIVKITQKKFSHDFDSFGNIVVRVDIVAEIDTESVSQDLKRKDLSEILQSYKILQTENEAQKNEIARLKRLVAENKTASDLLSRDFIYQEKQFKAQNLAKEALILEYSGNYDKALGKYNQIVTMFPNSALGYFQRGMFYRKIKEFQKSLDDLNVAVANASKNFQFSKELFLYRGLVKISLNQKFSAIEDFTQSIKINSNNPYAYFMRAVLYANQNEFQLAYDDASKAIELLPPNNAELMNEIHNLISFCSSKLKKSPS